MDFDSLCNKCAKTCVSKCQKYKASVSCQGDCKCSLNILDNENYWTTLDGKKRTRNSEEGAERRRKMQDVQCNCFNSRFKQSECELKHTNNQEKNSKIFESCNGPWNHLLSDAWKSKMSEFYNFDELNRTDGQNYFRNSHSSSDKILAENFLELEEKVDFLLQIFKEYKRKLSSEGNDSQIKTAETVFGDIWQLYNFNKRLRVAEEGIEKLAFILEELIKNPSEKKRQFFFQEDYSDSLNFEDMSISQRINFLKDKNDFLTNLMKSVLKIDLREDLYSKPATLPKEKDVKQKTSSMTNQEEKIVQKEFNKAEILDTLKRLRIQLGDSLNLNPKNCNIKESQTFSANGKKEDYGMKFHRNKLEVISEQGEYALNRKSESEIKVNELKTKNEAKHLKEKFSQNSDLSNCQESGENASKHSAQEALLKSSVDKVHYGLFPKVNFRENNFTKKNFNLMTQIQIPTKEESNGSKNEGNLSPKRDNSNVFFVSEAVDNSANDSSRTIGKYVRHKEFKEPNQENRSLAAIPSSTTEAKPNLKTIKKRHDLSNDKKNKKNIKTFHDISSTVSMSHQKLNRNLGSIPEMSSLTTGRSKPEAGDQRPMTVPNFVRKTPLFSEDITLSSKNYQKAIEEEKRNSGINKNVKNKNKIILNKKSFVRKS